MQRLLLTAFFAFVLGLSIGSFATGQKGTPTFGEEAQRPGKKDPVPIESSAQTATETTAFPILARLSEAARAERNGQVDTSSNITLGSMNETDQIETLHFRWAELEGLVGRLVNRVDSLERQVVTWQSDHAFGQEEETVKATELLPIDTPDDRRTALVTVGVPETIAEEIISRQSGLELERLELQDLAMREGWFRTDRYFDSLRELDAERVDLRAEIGEKAYDQYLFRTGDSNRMKVTGLIQGSAAEQSGLMPGDVIESYGGVPVFSLSDLRNATTQGSRDEIVPVIIRREGNLIEASISRGPMGVRVEADSISPNG